MKQYVGMGKKGLNYQLTISIIFGVVFLMSANFAFGQPVSFNPNVLNDQASRLIESGNYIEAIDLLNQALEIDPNHILVLNNKGNALLGLQMHEEAIVWYDKALEVNPNYLYALNNKGYALYGLEQYIEALFWVDRALEVDPNYVTAQQNKVLILQNLEFAEDTPEPESTNEDNGGGCLIATATYGSELAPQVQMLREIRDNSLMKTQSGQSFMQGFNEFYYSFSPAIADYERQNPVFKDTVKLTITPLLASLSILNYVEFDSEESVLGFGIGIIMLNIGMYFVAPTLMILRLSKKLSKKIPQKNSLDGFF